MKNALFLILGVLAIVSCDLLEEALDEEETGPIRIAVIGPQSESLQEFGIPTLRAAQLIAAEANGGGGVLEREVEVIPFDDLCDPTVADDIARTAIGSDIVGVVGHACSGATAVALPVYAPSRIPVVSPSATNPELTEGSYSFFFRTIAPDSATTQTMVNALEGGGASNIYLIADSRAEYWVDTAIERVETQIEAAGTHTGTSIVDLSGDLSSVATTVVGSSADALLVLPGTGGDYGADVAAVVNAMRTASFSSPIIATADAYYDSLIDGITGSADDVYVIRDVDIFANNQAAVDLNQDHIDAYGEDGGAYFIQGGAAMQVILEAIRRADSTDSALVVSEIQSGTFSTALGFLTFSNGDPSGSKIGYVVLEISGGTFVEVTP